MNTSTTQLRNNILKTVIVFVLSITFSFAQTSTETEVGQTITVTINDIKTNTGQVMFALHTSDSWMKSQGVQSESVSITDGKATVTFKNVTPGIYAIMALHDTNKNNKMDFENGMPKENYGMSNNPLSYGPPQFYEAKFEVSNENLELKIRF